MVPIRTLDTAKHLWTVLREDLWTAAADPQPPARRPQWVVVLMAQPLVAFAALLLVVNGNSYSSALDMGALGFLLAGIQAAALIAALYRPVLAWWATTAVEAVVIITQFAVDVSATDVAGRTATELPLRAWVLFMVALRARSRVAVETLVISVPMGLAFVLPSGHLARPGGGLFLVVTLAVAVAFGALLRTRQLARAELEARQGAILDERIRRTDLEERSRIARELHDVVAHHLSVISIQAQVAPHLVDSPPEELRENLRTIRQSATEALAELRKVLGVLRSQDTWSQAERHAPQPSLARLPELLGNLRAAGLVVTLETTGAPHPLPSGVELSAYRIIQEALSNVIRHAPGARAQVELDYRRSELAVRITNSTPDRPVPAAPDVGHGLLGMRERIAMLSGELATGATAEGGYEVIAVLPTETVEGAS